MPESVIGKPYTFQVLFMDALYQPMAVQNASIDIFQFNSSGVKQYWVQAAAMNPVTPPETGRYTYTYTLPTTLTDGDNLVGEMRGRDPDSGLVVRVEESVTAIASTRGGGGASGLIARFVKGG